MRPNIEVDSRKRTAEVALSRPSFLQRVMEAIRSIGKEKPQLTTNKCVFCQRYVDLEAQIQCREFACSACFWDRYKDVVRGPDMMENYTPQMRRYGRWLMHESQERSRAKLAGEGVRMSSESEHAHEALKQSIDLSAEAMQAALKGDTAKASELRARAQFLKDQATALIKEIDEARNAGFEDIR